MAQSIEKTTTVSKEVSSQVADDPMSIVHSDNPRMVLVTTLLNDKNYLIWSRSMRRALAVKNKEEFIDRVIAEQQDEPARRKWKRVDELVCSWLINSMSKELAETFVYCTSARALWVELEQ